MVPCHVSVNPIAYCYATGNTLGKLNPRSQTGFAEVKTHFVFIILKSMEEIIMERKTLIACTALGILLAAPVWANAAEPSESGAMQQQSSAQEQNRLMNMQVGEIKGRTVVNQQGDKLGKVDKVVQNNEDNTIQAVVSIGGFLGIGSKEITIPVAQLHIKDNNLQWSQSVSADELKQQPAFNQAQYRVIPENQTVAEASGATGAQTTQLSFQDLDTNNDGYISQEEAANDPALADNFSQADQNSDDQIDQSEFSAFEESQPGMSPSESGQQQQPESSGSKSQPESQSGSESGGSSM
jgi:sporulation protein YlmC with PRC-barrel domain